MTLGKNVLLMAVAAAISIGIIVYSSEKPSTEIDFKMSGLAGKWVKQTQDECAQKYPTKLNLMDTGFYEAPGATEEGAHWHGGDWSVASATELKIQMANDAIASYRFRKLPDGSLAITDGQGCEVLYQAED